MRTISKAPTKVRAQKKTSPSTSPTKHGRKSEVTAKSVKPTTPASEPVETPPGYRAVFICKEDYHQIKVAGQRAGLRDPVNDFVAWIMKGTAGDPESLAELASALAENQRNKNAVLPTA